MIHSKGCPFLPQESKRILLGKFSLSSDAEKAGKEFFNKSSSCPFCSKEPGKVVSRTAERLLNASADVVTEVVTFERLTPTWDSAMMSGVN